MIVSIITPFYKGNNYMKKLSHSIELNAKSCKKNNINIEHIIVNDSPGEKVNETASSSHFYKTVILNNSKNVGIHQTRINGLNIASGKYVMFLDQDDYIFPDAIFSLACKIMNADICVGNAYMCRGNRRTTCYRNHIVQKLASSKNVILYYNTLMLSPGQCLIKKDAISSRWKRNVMSINGADDEMLYLSMMVDGKKFAFNNQIVYQHNDTGNNLSSNYSDMCKSGIHGLKKLKFNEVLSKKKYNTYIRRRKMVIDRYGRGIKKRILLYFRNVDVSIIDMFIYILRLVPGTLLLKRKYK